MNGLMISNFLKKVRNEKSYTQDEMAKILGVSYRTYQRVEANESHLSATYFLRLLKEVDDTLFLSFIGTLSSFKNSKKFSIFNKTDIFKSIPVHHLKEKIPLDKVKDLSSHVSSWNGKIIVGYWEWDLSAHKQYWSDEMYEIYGVNPEKEIFPFEVSSLVQSDDVSHIEVGLSNLIEQNIPYVNQHRVKHSKGTCVVNATAIIFEENDKPLIIGSSKAYIK